METDKFQTILLGIIYNPKDKKILIGKRKEDPEIKELKWCFPGGKLSHKEDIEKTLKNKIKNKTGYEIINLGSILARIPEEKKDQVLIYYLCEVINGEEKKGNDLEELKWVSPEEIENYITTSFHPHLKEYILNLK